METEKLRKYDLLANELSLVHKCKVNIIPFVLTWDNSYRLSEKYRKDLKVSNESKYAFNLRYYIRLLRVFHLIIEGNTKMKYLKEKSQQQCNLLATTIERLLICNDKVLKKYTHH